MNPDQLLAPLKRLSASLSPRQLATLAAAFLGVVVVVAGSAWLVSRPTYALLYADLDPESAAAVVTQLRNQDVPYVLDDGGRAVRVPANRLDDLRLDLASQGLPVSGRIGFEIFDRPAFGTTDFLEHVNYRRGLEGELARTIATISEVSSARVHIALAKDSLFTGDAQEAKASVVLKLRNSKPLPPSTVAGIAGLVAGSVESLRPEAVVIVDTFGRPLSRVATAEDAQPGPSLDKQRRLEQDLAARVVTLLEPVVGAGHVRVNVSAALSANSQEETEERWDPTTVVRSQQISNDTGAAAGPAGLAGARANAPPAASTAVPEPVVAAIAAAAPSRTSETTNYEVSKLTRHTIAPSGQVARLSVAVIIDNQRGVAGEDGVVPAPAPRDPQEMERLRGLVAAAVGLNTERGDLLTVENIAFDEEASVPDAPVTWWQPWVTGVRSHLGDILRVVVVLVLALVAVQFVLRPMVRASVSPSQAQAPDVSVRQQPGRTVADLEGEIEAQLDAELAGAAGAARRLPALTKRIAQKASSDPDQVARLMRGWISEEAR